ncbi:hypothetical protein TNIN_114251 [Trichonephila inaurata madagascariensis]|uniref:Uncharacterized protein n=1 Tax=Trichonephila inaurata madagascariensis TaxID=2747483 RepID=A0A8X7CPX8_9ARAC|nr:hypothetical protein TNIN_114251 [Trichonephila inaurata madagascariensis]
MVFDPNAMLSKMESDFTVTYQHLLSTPFQPTANREKISFESRPSDGAKKSLWKRLKKLVLAEFLSSPLLIVKKSPLNPARSEQGFSLHRSRCNAV